MQANCPNGEGEPKALTISQASLVVHVVEMATSICIILSYLGWVSAQMTALGLVFNILSCG